MTNPITRYSKVLFGAVLIGIPLTTTSPLGYSILLPLLAIPVVLSGLFDWRPLLIAKEYVAVLNINKLSFTHGMKLKGSMLDLKIPST